MAFTAYTNTEHLQGPFLEGVPFAERFKDPPSKLRTYLLSRMQSAHSIGSTFVVLFIVDEASPWVSSFLASVFDGFPKYLLDALKPQFVGRCHTNGFSNTNELRKGGCDFSCALTYPYISNVTEDETPDDDLSPVQFTPIGTWICSSNVLNDNAIESSPERNLVVLLGSNHSVKRRIDIHFSGKYGAERRERLNQNPEWILIELYYLFSDWDNIWKSKQKNLDFHDARAYRDVMPSSLLDLTKTLHKDVGNMIVLRELLHLHANAIGKYRKLIEHPSSTGQQHEQLSEKVATLIQDLSSHQETSKSISCQLQNLLCLIKSTEIISQGRVLDRLNILAFIFLPLILVAALFGMITWTIEARWYPLWATVATIVGFIVVLIVNKIIDSNGDPPKDRKSAPSEPQSSGRFEKQPSPPSSSPRSGPPSFTIPSYSLLPGNGPYPQLPNRKISHPSPGFNNRQSPNSDQHVATLSPQQNTKYVPRKGDRSYSTPVPSHPAGISNTSHIGHDHKSVGIRHYHTWPELPPISTSPAFAVVTAPVSAVTKASGEHSQGSQMPWTGRPQPELNHEPTSSPGKMRLQRWHTIKGRSQRSPETTQVLYLRGSPFPVSDNASTTTSPVTRSRSRRFPVIPRLFTPKLDQASRTSQTTYTLSYYEGSGPATSADPRSESIPRTAAIQSPASNQVGLKIEDITATNPEQTKPVMQPAQNEYRIYHEPVSGPTSAISPVEEPMSPFQYASYLREPGNNTFLSTSTKGHAPNRESLPNTLPEPSTMGLQQLLQNIRQEVESSKPDNFESPSEQKEIKTDGTSLKSTSSSISRPSTLERNDGSQHVTHLYYTNTGHAEAIYVSPPSSLRDWRRTRGRQMSSGSLESGPSSLEDDSYQEQSRQPSGSRYQTAEGVVLPTSMDPREAQAELVAITARASTVARKPVPVSHTKKGSSASVFVAEVPGTAVASEAMEQTKDEAEIPISYVDDAGIAPYAGQPF